jgi:putative FmdB family regulatory protein
VGYLHKSVRGYAGILSKGKGEKTMPTYQFRCKKCQIDVDVFCSYEDVSKEWKCPDCGEIMVRVFTAPLIDYKGTGWTGAQKG